MGARGGEGLVISLAAVRPDQVMLPSCLGKEEEQAQMKEEKRVRSTLFYTDRKGVLN